ncbi:transcription elongation factor TFIIS-like protein [Tanacetum coccineum]
MESPTSNNTAVMSQNKVDRANSFKAARKEEIKVIKTEDIKVEKNGHNSAPISEIKLNNVKVEKKPTINEVAPPKLTSLVYCKDPIRDKMREILAKALCKVSEEADDESRDEVNAYFRRKILLGHVKPERIVELTPEEMASTERQMQIMKIKEKALFECERRGPQKATTDQFRCGRCGKRKITGSSVKGLLDCWLVNNFFELEAAVVKSSVIHKALSHLHQLKISGDYPRLYVREAIMVVRDSLPPLKDLGLYASRVLTNKPQIADSLESKYMAENSSSKKFLLDFIFVFLHQFMTSSCKHTEEEVDIRVCRSFRSFFLDVIKSLSLEYEHVAMNLLCWNEVTASPSLCNPEIKQLAIKLGDKYGFVIR